MAIPLYDPARLEGSPTPPYEQKVIDGIQSSWDTLSARYRVGTRIATDDVHDGPRLLGGVSGEQILEIGCDVGTIACIRGHLRTVEQILNDLVKAGSFVERLVEQDIEDVVGVAGEARLLAVCV